MAMLRWRNKLRRGRRIQVAWIHLSLIFLMLLIGAGCERVQKPDEQTADVLFSTSEPDSYIYVNPSEMNLEPNPRDIEWLICNPLDKKNIEEIRTLDTTENDAPSKSNEDSSANDHLSYPVYSGLINKAVEEGINQSIYASIDEVKSDLDPKTLLNYRGIRKIIQPETTMLSRYIYVSEGFNHNHILSVAIYASATYDAVMKEMTDAYVSTVRILNFDLNTGQQIPLSSIFTDDYDYAKVIDQYIQNMLSENGAEDETSGRFWGAYYLVKPFDGIRENQLFSMDINGLNLYFTETDDRFISDFSTIQIQIPWSVFEDHLAFDSRFMRDTTSLFENTDANREFVTYHQTANYSEDYQEFTDQNVKYSFVEVFKPETPSEVYSAFVEQTKNTLRSLITEKTRDYDMYGMVSTRKIGNYTNYCSEIYQSEGTSSRVIREIALYKNEKSTEVKLTLADLFKANSAYETLMTEAIYQDIHSENDPSHLRDIASKMTKESIRQCLRTVEFELYTTGIVFYIPINEVNDYWSVMIPFNKLGIEHLTIFD